MKEVKAEKTEDFIANFTINVDSSKEEVADYFSKYITRDPEVPTKIINNDISGDVLCDLEEKDLKDLQFKLGPRKKILNILNSEDIKKKFGNKQINEKITKNSSSKEVAEFFKNSLNYEGNLNNLDGKGLLEMNDEDINNLRLNIGQRKKLTKYIDHFKAQSIEEHKEKGDESNITIESDEKTIINFFKNKLNLSDKAINKLQIKNGVDIFYLDENSIEEIEEMTEEEKEKLKKFLKEFKIDENSPKEEVINFLEKKLNLSNKAIDKLGVDAESLFLLEDKDIDKEKITDQEKINLKRYLHCYQIKKDEKKKCIVVNFMY